MRHRVCCLALTLSALFPALTPADETDDLLKQIRAVKAEGAGSPAARAAWDRLVRQGPKALPRILAAMDTPDAAASNWLRLAFDDIVERERKAGGKGIRTGALLAFAKDASRQGRPRRLALDLIEELRPGTRNTFLARHLDDPEFRYDAIERVLAKVKADRSMPAESAVNGLRAAFSASRDLEQSRTVAARLKERGVNVSVADHLGFLRDWYLIGPFDANGRRGFTSVYPPERKVDLDATLDGKGGKKLRWKRETVAETPAGRFPILADLRKPLGDAEDAVAFAYTAFTSEEARTVEFRGAADDHFVVWVNGQRVFGFEEYQNGVRFDRHRFTARLRAGVNTVLVKVVQAPEAGNPAPNWEFLLRVTGPAGRGLIFPTALKAR